MFIGGTDKKIWSKITKAPCDYKVLLVLRRLMNESVIQAAEVNTPRVPAAKYNVLDLFPVFGISTGIGTLLLVILTSTTACSFVISNGYSVSSNIYPLFASNS